MSLQAADGQISIVHTTSEHPFHVRDWDGKVETLTADLSGTPDVDPSRLFPSDDQTPFGDWVKAGALKIGDEVSTRESVASTGPRLAANDNAPLTITEIIHDSRAARVYNFEVESRSGEITHNYFVGDEQAWVHNAGVGRNDPRLTWLYKLYDPKGNFLKHGVTCNPATRYPKNKGYRLKRQKCGCRSDMLDDERRLVETDPGPMNQEPWAGSGLP